MSLCVFFFSVGYLLIIKSYCVRNFSVLNTSCLSILFEHLSSRKNTDQLEEKIRNEWKSGECIL